MFSFRLIRVAGDSMRIWEPSSDFVRIIDQLNALYNNLPEKYYLTDANLFVLKEKGMLGGVFALHLFIHAVIFDLTRISLAGFSFPLASAFKNAPLQFRAHCQNLCRYHATQASHIIRTGMTFSPIAFDDLFCPDAIIESTKVQIIYTATVDQSPQTLQETRDNIITNFSFLLAIHNRGKEAPIQFVHFPLSNSPRVLSANGHRYGALFHFATFLAFGILQRDTKKRLGMFLLSSRTYWYP